MSAVGAVAGTGQLAVALVDGASAVVAAAASDPLKLLASTPRGPCAWVYTTTYGGGLLAGDAVALEVEVGAGARLLLATQASTKIYRSEDGRCARQTLRARVGAGALLAGLPDPVTPFADARHEQRTDIDLAADAGLIWLDGVTAGRVARDERWACARHRSRLAVRRDGRPLLLDAIDLAPGLRPLAERLGPAGALATLVVGGPALAGRAAAIAAAVAERRDGAWPLAGCAPLGGGWGVVVRLAAHERESGERLLRALLGDLRALLGDDPWARRP